MFSSRLPSSLASSALANLIADVRASGTRLFDLTESNPTLAGFVYPEPEVLAGFSDPRALLYHPEPLGLPGARAAIAALEDVTADRVVLTASTSEAYSWLLKLLCDPGDEILVPQPSYPLFDLLAGLESVAVRKYPLRYYRDWYVDMHALEAAVTDRTRAVVVVNPNNPTGSFLKRHELAELASLCARRELALISDEVFRSYALLPDTERASTVNDLRSVLSFSLNGLSKMAGLPQMKLGWMVVSGPRNLVKTARERMEMIADTFLSVGTPVQYALPALIAASESVRSQILARVQANLADLRTRISGSPISLLNLEGGWYATLRVPATRGEEQWVTTLLRKHHVLLQPGYFYDFDSEAFLIVSLLTQPEIFREGIWRVVEESLTAV